MTITMEHIKKPVLDDIVGLLGPPGKSPLKPIILYFCSLLSGPGAQLFQCSTEEGRIYRQPLPSSHVISSSRQVSLS
ncbi:hypothetical protein ACFX13_044137 [Malus domestica]